MDKKQLNKVMAKIRRKLAKYGDLENTHCGHDELVMKAVYAKWDLIELIKSELIAASAPNDHHH